MAIYLYKTKRKNETERKNKKNTDNANDLH